MSRYKSHWARTIMGVMLSFAAVALLSQPAWAANPSNGAQIYATHCGNCHGDTGAGNMPGTPDFRRGDAMFQPDRALADSIRLGKQVMPGFQGLLTDQEIYDVIAFLRTFR